MSKNTNTFKILAGPALEKEIELIGKAGPKFEGRIFVAAVSAVAHLVDHGNTTPLKGLFNALPKSTRRNSYLAWCEDIAGVIIITKNPKGKALKAEDYAFRKGRTLSEDDIQKAIDAGNPLTYKSGSEGTAFKGFDLTVAIGRIVAQAERANEKVIKGEADAGTVKIDNDILMILKGFASAGAAAMPQTMIN